MLFVYYSHICLFILVVQSLVHIVQLKSNSFVITVLEITHNLSLPLLLKLAPGISSKQIMVAKMKVLSKLSFNVNIQNNLMQAMWCFNYLKKDCLEASTIFSVSPMLCFMQAKSCVKPDYMSSQQDINAKMRAILIDWLIEVKKGVHLITLY